MKELNRLFGKGLSNIFRKFDFLDVLFIVLFILMSIFYFKVPIFFMPDSAGYYDYLDIFYGLTPFSQWDPVRGPSFPLLIFLATLIGGKSNLTLLVLSFLFYALLLVVSWILLKSVFERLKTKGLLRISVAILFFLLIILNTILFGYFHAFLTEFVTIPIALVSSLLAWKWLSTDFTSKSGIYLVVSVLLGGIFLFVWFLKQPYISIILFPVLIAVIISILETCSLRNIFQRFLTFGFCLLLMLTGIFCWDRFLTVKRVNRVSSEINRTFISGGIINGISNLKFDRDLNPSDIASISEDNYLDEPEKAKVIEKLLSGEELGGVLLLEVTTPSGDIIDKLILVYEGESLSFFDSLSFFVKIFIQYPLIVIDSYWANYLAAINIWETRMDFEYNYFYPERSLSKSGYENRIIALSFLDWGDNFMWIPEGQDQEYKELYKVNNPNLLPELVEVFTSSLYHNIFKLLYAVLPFLSIFAILRRFMIQKSTDLWVKNYYNLIIIFFLSSFLHSLLHIVMGAIIDRYLYVAFPQVVLGILLVFVSESRIGNSKKCHKGEMKSPLRI